jgi:hypothetical protein
MVPRAIRSSRDRHQTKVRDDVQFLAVHAAIVTPIILINASWNDALAEVPKFFAGGLLSGVCAKLKEVLRRAILASESAFGGLSWRDTYSER